MKKETAENLIKKTKEDYNIIAAAFSAKRDYLWQEMKNLAHIVIDGEKVLDFGCGSGRLADAFKEKNKAVDYYGVDISSGLIKEARSKHPGMNFSVIGAPPSRLPFGDGFFNAVFAIAVFHHIPSKELRKKTLLELNRVLKKDGTIVLSVWKIFFKRSLPLLARYTTLKISGKIDMDFKDILFPWKNDRGETVVQRYIHLFSRRELKKLLEECGFSVKKAYLADNKRNIYIIAQKNG